MHLLFFYMFFTPWGLPAALLLAQADSLKTETLIERYAASDGYAEKTAS